MSFSGSIPGRDQIFQDLWSVGEFFRKNSNDQPLFERKWNYYSNQLP